MTKHRPTTRAFINLTLLLVTTIVLLVFGFTDYLREKNSYYAELNRVIEQTTEELAASLALPIWNFQDDQAIKIIENAFLNKDISAVLVHDALSDRVVAGRMRIEGNAIAATDSIAGVADQIIAERPIVLADRVIGKITLQGTTRNIQTLAQKALQRIALTIATLNIVLYILLNIVLKRHIDAPLKLIENFAREISMQGSLTTTRPRDAFLLEMNSLRDSIVVMVERLQQQYDALAESQRKLRSTETRYRDLYENALAGIFRMSSSGQILTANAAFANILGYNAPEEAVRNVTSLKNQVFKDGTVYDLLMARLDETEQVSNYIISFKKTDGEERVGALGLRTIRETDDQQEYIDGILHDMTERFFAERKVREAHAFIQEILDSMPSVVIGVDNQTTITHCNKKAQNETGLDARRLLGMKLADALPRMIPHEPAIISALQERKTVLLTNQPHETDGATRLESILAFPVYSGELQGAVIRIDDVTDQAKMEELILQTEKMMSVGGLAAGMAHEINNPLAGILLGVQNIIRRFSPDMQSNRKLATETGCDLDCVSRYLDARGIRPLLYGIRDSGERAAKIVSNMLSFARQSQSHHMVTRLDDLMDKCIDLASTDYDLKKKYDFKQIRIIREYSPETPEILCSPQELEQVMLNLLKNAAYALNSAFEQKAPPQIIVRLRKEDDWAVIEVEDNGPGISDTHKRQIFEPFFTTKQPGDGTGLGLSVSYFIITRNHNGKIWLDTEFRSGARFCIQLPSAASSATPPAQ
ncbi:PAS domain S-box protein [Desulfovibrio mangrovi]|uniref:PAS domain-containing sensor histidine kinase n=1 Tax=Desulfovibrio mangrovi TaxID=2976983 RepID=UPI00224598EB|nr:PAS domain-containing sensor histidine kinase [Desulfovibrio mangrovi]UZP68100.1 PAS domain S-box protein [Desulfovibrio mangrovi]